MTEDVSLEIQVGLAQCLGIAGVLFALVAWRASAVAEKMRVVRNVRSARDMWPIDAKYVRFAYWKRFEILLLIVAIVSSAVVWLQSIDYVKTVDLLMHAKDDDIAVFTALAVRLDRIKHDIVDTGLLATAFFMIEYVVANVLHVGGDALNVEMVSHPWTVPHSWRTGPEAMWEARVAIIRDDARLKSDFKEWLKDPSWRRTWSAWAATVVSYHTWTDLERRQVAPGPKDG